MSRLVVVTALVLIPAVASAQEEAARSAPQQATEPNYGAGRDSDTGPGGQEMRPGSPDGDYPSASAGRLTRTSVERRILGLPVDAVLVIGVMLLGLIALAGLVVPRGRRRARARGNGTYGGH